MKKSIIIINILFLLIIPLVFSSPSISFTANTQIDNSTINKTNINVEIETNDIDGLKDANIYLYDESINEIRRINFPSSIETFTAVNYGSVSFSASPLITENYIFTGGDDGILTQLNKNNLSETISSFTTNGAITSSPIVDNGYIYVGDTAGYIYQLDANNLSNVINIFDDSISGRGFINKLTITGNYLYFGNNIDGVVYQLDANNVSIIVNTYTASDIITAPILINNGFAYFCDISFYCYKLDSIDITQLISKTNSFGGSASEVTINNGYLYVADMVGILRQFSANNLSLQFNQYDTGTQFNAKPVIINDYLYIGNYEPKLYQFNATDVSKLINSYTLGGAVFNKVVYAYGSIYVATGDNLLSQFNANNISLLINQYSSGNEDNFYLPENDNGNLFIVSSIGQILKLSTANITTPLISQFNSISFDNLADGTYLFNASVSNINDEVSLTSSRTILINTSIPFIPPPPIIETGYHQEFSSSEIVEPIIDLIMNILITFLGFVPKN